MDKQLFIVQSDTADLLLSNTKCFMTKLLPSLVVTPFLQSVILPTLVLVSSMGATTEGSDGGADPQNLDRPPSFHIAF